MLISEILSKAAAQSALIVLVHGRSGNVKVMQTFKSILPPEATVVSLQAPDADPEGGFSWWDFKSENKFSDGAETGAEKASVVFLNWLHDFIEEQALSPKCIVAVGFSQGAALISYIAQIKPELFKGVAMLAGFIVQPKLQSIALDEISTKTKFFIGHGDKDEIVPISFAVEGAKILKKKGYQVSFLTDSVGHKIGVNSMQALKAWLAEIID